uniref:Motile sperm domain-containing 3 n=1 Tax=Xenopus tropicalis TaxID=8364 RepID=A0A803J5H7_XENTR
QSPRYSSRGTQGTNKHSPQISPTPVPECEFSLAAPVTECEFSLAAPVTECEFSLAAPVTECEFSLAAPVTECEFSLAAPVTECEFSLAAPVTECEFSLAAPVTECECSLAAPVTECEFSLAVLCTAPLRYTVVEAEGLVKPNSCIDIVTRHRDIRARNYGTTDKFRVDVWEEGASRGRGGRKDIAATLHATKPQAAERPPHVSLPWHPPSHVYSMQHGFPRTLSPWLFGLYILAGLVSMVILILPLHGDTRSLLHENLQVSVVQKLVAAYVLGLLTMVFLQG